MTKLEQQIFTFPPPLTPEHISQVRSDVLSTLAPWDVPSREYFLDCWDSLVSYVVTRQNQRKNYSLSIGYFRANFTGPTTDEEIFSDDNIWVKVRVTGGFLDVFKNRYMATQIGVSKIDWKNKTIKKLAKKAGDEGFNALSGALEEHKQAGAYSQKASGYFLQKLEDHHQAQRLKRMVGFYFRPAEVYSQLRDMPESDLEQLIASNQFEDYAGSMFRGLDIILANHSLDAMEFQALWSGVLHLPRLECEPFFRRKVGGDKLEQRNFTAIFADVMRLRVSARNMSQDDPITAKYRRAKEQLDMFFTFDARTYCLTMGSKNAFEQFAWKVFCAVSGSKAENVSKQDLVRFLALLNVGEELVCDFFSTPMVSFQQFKDYLYQFISESYAKITDQGRAMWTILISDWMKKGEDELNQLQDSYFFRMADALFQTVGAIDSLTFEQFQQLESDLHLALSQPPRLLEDNYIRFGLYADYGRLGERVLTRDTYVDILKAVAKYVQQLNADRESARQLDTEIFQALASGSQARIDASAGKLFNPYSENGVVGLDNYVRLLELKAWNTSAVVSKLSPGYTVTVEELMQEKLVTMKEAQGKAVEEQCRVTIGAMLAVSMVCLMAYQYADYKHLAAAGEIFAAFRPYHAAHNPSMFARYKGVLAELFNASEQYIDSLYHNYNGNMSVEELAAMLKDLLMTLVAGIMVIQMQ